jgi:hypothetical protein
VSPTQDAEYPVVPKAATGTVTVGSFEDYVTRYAAGKGVKVEELTTKDIEAARKAYMQADDRPRITVNTGAADDTAAIGDAIIRGEAPPTLQGLYSKGAAVRAYLAKKGFNLADAQLDWMATQRHVAALNGAQQTRLHQAIDNAAHSLDVIEDLAKQWDAGRFPALNSVVLKSAKAGVLGPQAASIATKLDAQIADVTSELANVYMGGNSPTDHALQLAAHNLNAAWSKGTLIDMVNLGRKNLQIRANSMRNIGVSGGGAMPGNVYAPTAPPVAPPTMRFNPATGKVEPIK